MLENRPVRPRTSSEQDILERADSFSTYLDHAIKGANIDPDSINSILELGPGPGIKTLGALSCFPQARITAIDYYDLLIDPAKNNERVEFRRGLFVNEISTLGEEGAEFDMLLLFFISRTHGINHKSAEELRKLLYLGSYIVVYGLVEDHELCRLLEPVESIYNHHDYPGVFRLE